MHLYLNKYYLFKYKLATVSLKLMPFKTLATIVVSNDKKIQSIKYLFLTISTQIGINA